MIIFKSVSNLERPKISNFFETYDMSSIITHMGTICGNMGSVEIRPISALGRPEVENPPKTAKFRFY